MIRIVSMDKILRFTNTLITISIFTLGFKSNTEVEVVAAVVVVVVVAFLSWILGSLVYTQLYIDLPTRASAESKR